MRTYVQFKFHFLKEDYLEIPNAKHRKAMTRLRISAHRLAIERGRYNNTPLEKRLGLTCDGEVVEDEYHFLVKCSKYETQRKSLFEATNYRCASFKHLNEYDKFIFLMSAGVNK